MSLGFGRLGVHANCEICAIQLCLTERALRPCGLGQTSAFLQPDLYLAGLPNLVSGMPHGRINTTIPLRPARTTTWYYPGGLYAGTKYIARGWYFDASPVPEVNTLLIDWRPAWENVSRRGVKKPSDHLEFNVVAIGVKMYVMILTLPAVMSH